MRRCLPSLILIALTGWGVFGAAPATRAGDRLPEADTIVRGIVQRARAVSENASLPVATYTNVSVYQTLASDGSVKKSKEKVYRVTLRSGMTENELLAVDGRPLSGAEHTTLNEKERKWRDTYAAGRDGGSPRRMDQVINERLFARFDLQVTGEEVLRHHRCWVIDLKPKAVPPPEERLMDRVFNRLTGRAWVDVATHEIVRVEAHTTGSLRVWGGIVGSLETFQIHLDREDAGQGVWYNRHLDIAVKGRKLFSGIAMRAIELAGPVQFAPPAPPAP